MPVLATNKLECRRGLRPKRVAIERPECFNRRAKGHMVVYRVVGCIMSHARISYVLRATTEFGKSANIELMTDKENHSTDMSRKGMYQPVS